MVLPQMDPYPSLASNASVGLCFSSYKQLSHCESRYCMENKCYESHNECPHHTVLTKHNVSGIMYINMDTRQDLDCWPDDGWTLALGILRK